MYILIIKTNLFKTQKNISEINKAVNKYFFGNKELVSLLSYRDFCFKLSVLDKESLDIILKKITELKLSNEKFEILGKKLEIKELKIEKSEIKNEIKIKFLTPTFFKIGSNFKEEFSLNIFIKWLSKKYNNSKGIKEVFSPRLLEGIKIKNQNFTLERVLLNTYEINGFKGEINLDISELDTKDKEYLMEILNFGVINNIGYKNNKGYGKIKIN